ncbi:hypothetical protein ACIHFD_49660 [Nonomuraea sp. NPDC051941]|uniref:hypothetical protein n=1 Tax=Nonomuraea sp. NPDC051941 TaxID=3364373 RepID=UPI0037C7BE60
MVQFRAMDDNADDVADVLAVALPWLQACPDLVLSGTRELGHRGGGGRVVWEVLLAPAARQRAQAERVKADRVDEPAPQPRRRAIEPPRRRHLT